MAKLVAPWARKLADAQAAGDLQHYNDKFNSFTQLSQLLERITGRGSDPRIAEQVKELEAQVRQITPPPINDTGPTPYEAQKAADGAWE